MGPLSRVICVRKHPLLEDDVQSDTVPHFSVTIHEYTIPWWAIVLIVLVVAIMLALVIPLFGHKGSPPD